MLDRSAREIRRKSTTAQISTVVLCENWRYGVPQRVWRILPEALKLERRQAALYALGSIAGAGTPGQLQIRHVIDLGHDHQALLVVR